MLKTKTCNVPAEIVHSPRVCGGDARIAGTRITVRTIESLRRQGATVDRILAMYPRLQDGQVRAAFLYADENTDEIDASIRNNEDA